VREELWVLVYHLKMEWDTAKDISLPERRFLIYRLIEQREKEQEEMKKSSKTPSYSKRRR
jgi:hypothetical protein